MGGESGGEGVEEGGRVWGSGREQGWIRRRGAGGGRDRGGWGQRKVAGLRRAGQGWGQQKVAGL